MQIIRHSIYTFASVLLFFAGVVLYGAILNLRVESLDEAMLEKGLQKIESPKIVVFKSTFTLQLYSGDILVKNYRAVFGKSKLSIKKSPDDHVTPTGKYKICTIENESEYYKFLQINYPNQRDAAEAFKNGYISVEEFNRIKESITKNLTPCAKTKIGGKIGIHGIGQYDIIFKNLPFSFNWTNGSIAVSNKSIDELLSVVKIGTPVEIRN